MKIARIISGVAMAIGFILIMCVVGSNDYYMEMGIPHSTNFILAAVGICLIVPAPFILNLPEGKSEWQKKNDLKLK